MRPLLCAANTLGAVRAGLVAALVTGLAAGALATAATAETVRLPSTTSAIGSPAVYGTPRLQSAVTFTVGVPVQISRRSSMTLDVRIAGQRCVRTQQLYTSGTMRVQCRAAARTADIPRAAMNVYAALSQPVNGKTLTYRRAWSYRLPVADGYPLDRATAQQRWQSIVTYLEGRLGTTRAAASVTTAEVLQRNPAAVSSMEAANALVNEVSVYGWGGEKVPALVNLLLSTRKSDGGFGLPWAWDAYGDGTVNPASTSYTITTAGHVGWIMLQGYNNGAFSLTDVQRTIDSVLATPRINGCLAYSRSRFDASKPCVYNVSFTSLAWLQAARSVGYRVADIDVALANARSHIRQGYNSRTGYWVYMAGNTVAQDTAHQVVTARSAEAIDPSFPAVATMMARAWWWHPNGLAQHPALISEGMASATQAHCEYATSPAVLYAVDRGARSDLSRAHMFDLAVNSRDIARRCLAG